MEDSQSRTAYLDSLLDAGLEDAPDEVVSSSSSDGTDDVAVVPDGASADESATLQLKVDSLLRQICGDDKNDPEPEASSTAADSAEKSMPTTWQAECWDSAPPGRWDRSVSSTRPVWQIPVPKTPGWIPSAPRPFWQIPVLETPAEVRAVVNANNFHPTDFFFVAHTLLQQHLRRPLRHDDALVRECQGQWVLKVKELELELRLPAAGEHEITSKQALYAMLALRLQLGTDVSGKRHMDDRSSCQTGQSLDATSSKVPCGKKKKNKKTKKDGTKTKKKKKEAGGGEKNADSKNVLLSDLVWELARSSSSRRDVNYVASQVSADRVECFGKRFQLLRKKGEVKGTFKAWLQEIPGLYVTGPKNDKIIYTPQRR